MKAKYFHSLFVMILMLCVFMMGVTNASNERIKKLEQDEEMNVSSERQICKQKKNQLLPFKYVVMYTLLQKQNERK